MSDSVETATPETTRRAGVDAVPILLADNNFWGLAVPGVWLRPHFVDGVDDDGRAISRVEIVREHESLQLTADVLRSLEDPAACFEAVKKLAVELLTRAHEVDSDMASTLLDIPEQRLSDWTAEVLAVAVAERSVQTETHS